MPVSLVEIPGTLIWELVIRGLLAAMVLIQSELIGMRNDLGWVDLEGRKGLYATGY